LILTAGGFGFMETINSVRGFRDILPPETDRWRWVEETAHEVFSTFGFQEIRIPVLEKTELFRRGIGESTDIVEKEMYTFTDRGEDSLTLRPEATASVIRAYIEHSLHAAASVTKLYTIGPMFRRERPQKGRYRQFHQIDTEILGPDDPRTDAELLLMLTHFLGKLGLQNLSLEINSLGCPNCRPAFQEAIVSFLRGREEELCPDCRRRLKTNPLRVFDCKVESCARVIAEAPRLPDFLCADCRSHFTILQESLALFALPFKLNQKMVRGLDYYTRTTFEITTEFLGAQNAVVGGGRYDHLVRDLGGPDIPGIGFAIGFERLVAMIPETEAAPGPLLFIAAIGDAAMKKAFFICNQLRMKGLSVEMDYAGRSLKSQMKRADKQRCQYALILGEREIEENKASLRNMQTGVQEEANLDNLEETIIKSAR
jgi:histidyl-tRNA synthetase